MIKYIAFLKGVNVGGKNRIKMGRLAKLMLQNGLDNVRPYLQSGNIIFEARSDSQRLIHDIIADEWGPNIIVVSMPFDEVARIFAERSYSAAATDSQLFAFCDTEPSPEVIAKLEQVRTGEEFTVDGNVIYMRITPPLHKSKLFNAVSAVATVRNYNTVSAIVSIIS